MTPTPRLQRRSKLQTGYRIAPDIERKMDALIESGEFVNRADIITTALRFWFDYRKFDVDAEIVRFLQSDGGGKMILDIVNRDKKQSKK